MGLTSGNDEIIRRVLLEHEPHGPDIVLSVTPITPSVEIPELDGRSGPLPFGQTACNLAGYELDPSSLRLVIEKDSRARVQTISLPVVLGYPIPKNLR